MERVFLLRNADVNGGGNIIPIQGGTPISVNVQGNFAGAQVGIIHSNSPTMQTFSALAVGTFTEAGIVALGVLPGGYLRAVITGASPSTDITASVC